MTCLACFLARWSCAGRGIGEVTAIGLSSEIGKIGQSLSTLETEPPRLRAQTEKLVAGCLPWSEAR